MKPVYQRYFLVACCPATGSSVKPVLNVVLSLYLYNLFLLAKQFTAGVSPLPITRFVNGEPPKHWSRFLTWKWGTLENLIRNSCNSARTSYNTASKPVGMWFLVKLFCMLTQQDRIMFTKSCHLSRNRGVLRGVVCVWMFVFRLPIQVCKHLAMFPLFGWMLVTTGLTKMCTHGKLIKN